MVMNCFVRDGVNAVATRLSPNWYYMFHGFHPWLSNDTAPQLKPSYSWAAGTGCLKTQQNPTTAVLREPQESTKFAKARQRI